MLSYFLLTRMQHFNTFQEFHSSSEFDKQTFLSFVKQLEGTLLQPYHAVLEELQVNVLSFWFVAKTLKNIFTGKFC